MRFLFALFFLFVLILSCSPKAKHGGLESDNWRYYYDLGMSSFYAKNYSDAISKLYKASLLAPEEPKVWNALGLTYMEVKEYEKAERSFKKALEVSPSFTEAKMNLGILKLKAKELQQASDYLREALSDESFDKKHIAYFYLAKIHKELGNTREYLRNLEKATAYNPLFIEAQLELGEAYIELKEYEKAEKLYNELLSNNITLPDVYLSLAKIYFHKRLFEDAKAMIKLVLENKMTSNTQRSQAYDLLSKVLIKEQESLALSYIKPKVEPKPSTEAKKETEKKDRVEKDMKEDSDKKDVKRKKTAPQKQEKDTRKKSLRKDRYAIQIAAFSSERRAKKLMEEMRKRGLLDVRILKVRGIHKVVYGSFENRRLAREELERLKRLDIYGFIVEVR